MKIERILEEAKDIAIVLFVIVLLLFMACGIYFSLFGIGSGPISVTVGDGRHSTLYKTNKVVQAGPGCIKFKADGDTVIACGNYKIRK
jgi:hypothetical protein